MKKYFLGILSFLLIGVYSAFPSFAMGTNFDDISDISALSENHAQFIGNTGTTARSFTSISFFVSGLTSYPNTSGASGLNIFCYYGSAWNSCGSITPLSASIIRVSDGATVSFSGLDTEEIYKITFTRSSAMNLPENADIYFRYTRGDTYEFYMYGSSQGSGALKGDYNDDTIDSMADDTDIGSISTCWNGECGAIPDPTITVSQVGSFDPLNSSTVIDLEGNFYQVAEDYEVDLQIWSECTKTGFADVNSDSPVVHVRFYANQCNTTTQKIADSEYIGSLYCADPEDSEYLAEGITLPYVQGFSCTYPMNYIIRERTCTPITVGGVITGYQCNLGEIIAEGDLETYTPATSTDDAGALITDPEPTDPLAWVVWKIKNVIIELFSFKNVDLSRVDSIKSNLQTRAPFAYGMAVYDLDFDTYTLGSSTAPSFVFNIAYTADDALPSSVTYDPSQIGTNYTSFLTTVRGIFEFVIWSTFIGYIIYRVRGLAEKL